MPVLWNYTLSIYIVNLLHTGARKLRTAASDGTYEDGKSTRKAVMKFVAVHCMIVCIHISKRIV